MMAKLLIHTIFAIISIWLAHSMRVSYCHGNNNPDLVISNNLMKILASYLQVIAVISAFPLNWPAGAEEMFSFVITFSPNIAKGIPYECFFRNHFGILSKFYIQILFVFLNPVFMSLCFIILYSLYRLITNFLQVRSRN